MSHTHALALERYHLYINRLMALCALLCAASVLSYGVFLLLAVEHAAARTTAQESISALSGRVGDLETQYLSAARALTPQVAGELGYVAPQQVATVYATAASGALSLRVNQ